MSHCVAHRLIEVDQLRLSVLAKKQVQVIYWACIINKYLCGYLGNVQRQYTNKAPCCNFLKYDVIFRFYFESGSQPVGAKGYFFCPNQMLSNM